MILVFVVLTVILNEGLSAEYKKVGCFKDHDEPRRALRAHLSDGSGSVVKCAREAKARGFTVFGLQNGGECWSGKGNYAKYGRGEGCKDGLGGSWRNDVYKFPVAEYKGCFNSYTLLDVLELHHAIKSSSAQKYDYKHARIDCENLAKSRNAVGFAIQWESLLSGFFGTRLCYTISSGDKPSRFGKHSLIAKCDKNRLGGYRLMSVYLFK
ncbi:uncharacterized protein LOC110247861 [Exaiptasia diaphana]|uniref:WSC domain-containing protein n=1 Tax=Exaiptasia diaphana TaxID=2652724 RepID=A0A913XJR1_EXADI|nr:uncharacterized protein LOC110244067 [Exaiptasia diaphana]XP_020910008.1 uncharacterized protein LOC110247861 [Exaiptasia diaphana]